MTSPLATRRLVPRLARPGPMPRRTKQTLAILLISTTFACAALITIGHLDGNQPGKLFGEGKPGTLLSVGLLAASALLCHTLYRRLAPLSHAHVWLALAFLFLLTALDDLFKFHEKLDALLLSTLGFDTEGRLDSLDDILVALYAVPAALLVLTSARNYFLRLRWTVLILAAACILFAGMVAIDMIAEHDAGEETVKLLAAALIFAGVAAAEHAPLNQRLFRRARHRDAPQG